MNPKKKKNDFGILDIRVYESVCQHTRALVRTELGATPVVRLIFRMRVHFDIPRRLIHYLKFLNFKDNFPKKPLKNSILLKLFISLSYKVPNKMTPHAFLRKLCGIICLKTLRLYVKKEKVCVSQLTNPVYIGEELLSNIKNI